MDEEVKKALEEQGKLIKEIHQQTTALHRALVWGRIWDAARFVLFFIVPIILGYLYLFPLYQKYTNSLKALQRGEEKPAQFLQEMPALFKVLLPLAGVDFAALEQQARNQGNQLLQRIK